MYITIYPYTHKCLRLKVRSGCEVLIVKEDTAISLHLNSGLMGVQKRTPISDKDTGNGKREGR